ncbi:MAG TPA: hypothetical protein VKU44_04905, partial [Terriglobia bacterium]|nr:hypothetical protein [Terriglobia bacterium]
MSLTRRYFLKSAGLSLFGAGFVPSFIRRTAFALEPSGASNRKKVLVAIFQRGAADGLNIVVPFGDKQYYALRPTINIPEPRSGSAGSGGSAGEGQSLIDLDGFFGFHPSLAPLKPLFDARELAVIHAVGSPDNTRSHFDAQDYMETATPGSKSAEDGWLNRYLQAAPEAEATPFRAVALAPRMPRTLQGQAPALAIDDLRAFRLRANPNQHLPSGTPLEGAFEALYASASDPLISHTARETFDAVSALERLGVQSYQPANGVEYPH